MPCFFLLLGLGALGAPADEPAKGSLDNLVKNSPFGSAAAPGAPGAENSQLEFRGTLTDQGEQLFSFFDPATRTSQWVGLKETGAPYSVQSYDAATQSVKVLFHNQTFNLTLKRAQIVVQALPPPTVLPPGGGVAPPAPVVNAPAAGDEAARLAQVAEEIRRRRALRAQGGAQPVQPPSPSQPPTAGSPPMPNR